MSKQTAVFFLGLFLSTTTAFASDSPECRPPVATRECIDYVKNQRPYPTATDAARACAGWVELDCVKHVVAGRPYPTALDSAKACKGGVTVECMRALESQPPYPTALDAARACAGQ